MFLGSFGLSRRLHAEMKFDLIDAHYVYPDGFAAVLLGKLLSIPVVVSARGTDINLFPSFPMIRPMIRWTLHHAVGIITVSKKLKQAVLDLGIQPDKVQVISNGIDTHRFFPVDQSEARRQLGLPLDSQMVVSVGALVPYKGFQFLIPAVAEIASTHPQLRVNIVGDGPYRHVLERLIRKHGVRDRVFLVGNRPNEDLKYWFSAADLSCLLSSREGYPNVVLESLACGTPVLATKAGGITEVITSEALGILVDPGQESITSGLRRGLEKHWDRAAMARQIASRTWETVSMEVEEFLRSRIPADTK
jgi:glycosyltransferase involved in cell wall biosynthesis